MRVKPKKMQTWFDIAIYYTGDPNHAFELSKINNQSITDDLELDVQIVIPESLKINKKNKSYLLAHNIEPATAMNYTGETIKPTGIGYMTIEQNFKVG